MTTITGELHFRDIGSGQWILSTPTTEYLLYTRKAGISTATFADGKTATVTGEVKTDFSVAMIGKSCIHATSVEVA
jgi:hypothetical protein